MGEPAANYSSSKAWVANVGGNLSSKAAVDLSDWKNLLNLRPPGSVKDADKKRFPAQRSTMATARDPAGQHLYAPFGYQPIEGGSGDINMDMYVVEITTPPKTLDGKPFSLEQLQLSIRTTFARFMDPSIAVFRLYQDQDEKQWAGSSLLGAVGHFDMKGITPGVSGGNMKYDVSSPDACVVCTEYDSYHWVFSTIQVPNLNIVFDGMHPVNGNRQFGVAVRKAGVAWSAAYGGNFPPPDKDTMYWYTRGVDRVADNLKYTLPEYLGGTVFEGGDKCWLGLQRNVDAWLRKNGASTRSAGLRRSKREKWDGFVGETKYGLWTKPAV